MPTQDKSPVSHSPLVSSSSLSTCRCRKHTYFLFVLQQILQRMSRHSAFLRRHSKTWFCKLPAVCYSEKIPIIKKTGFWKGWKFPPSVNLLAASDGSFEAKSVYMKYELHRPLFNAVNGSTYFQFPKHIRLFFTSATILIGHICNVQNGRLSKYDLQESYARNSTRLAKVALYKTS